MRGNNDGVYLMGPIVIKSGSEVAFNIIRPIS